MQVPAARAAEVAGVAALVAVAGVEVAGGERSWPLAAHLLVVLLAGVGVLLSRTRPVPGVAVAVLPVAVQALSDFVPSAGMLVLCLLLTGRAGAVPDPRARQAAVALVALGLLVVVLSDPTTDSPGAAVPSVVMFGAALAIGTTSARRSRAAAERVAAAEAARRAQEEQAHEALAQERARLARELHDVVTHSLSVVVVQAGAARLDAPPDQAARLGAIEDTARSALAEMRRLLGVLRGDPGDELRPQPGLEQLPELVAQVRATGSDVRVRTEGRPRPLPPGLDLAAYRVLQEGATNVLKHASGSAVEVHVGWHPDRLLLRVSDDATGVPTADAGGHGLLGLAERVALYGGTLRHGRLPAGGYELVVELPLADTREPVP